MIAEMSKCVRFRSKFAEPFYVTDIPEYGDSYFDSLWRTKGRTIHYHQFYLHG
jgi:tRNA (guanine-N7-)-methyltransferase